MYRNKPKFESELFALDPTQAKLKLKPEDWTAEQRKLLGPGQTSQSAIQVLQALLDAGAKPDQEDLRGFTSLDLAKAHGQHEVLGKIMGIDPQQLAAKEGAATVMHGGATYWMSVHGGYRSSENA